MNSTEPVCMDATAPSVRQGNGCALADSDFLRSLAGRIECGDEAGLSDLYEALHRRYRRYFGRQIGVEFALDAVHELFVMTVDAVKMGRLRDPENLTYYVRGIVRHQSYHYVADKIRRRETERPMASTVERGDFRFASNRFVLESERQDLIRSCLDSLPPRQREILQRFYLCEESPEQIQAAMNVGPQQYRLLKWRAKSAFGEIGRKRMSGVAAGTLAAHSGKA